MTLGALAGCAGVALGAATAHAFAARLEAAALANLATASQYLLVHGVLLIAIAFGVRAQPTVLSLRVAGALIALGVVCFCGGVIVSTLSGVRAFAALAPAGGTALLAGWLTLALYGLTKA